MTGDYIDGNTRTRFLQNMESLPDNEFISFLNNLDAVMFDCDGVLWLGSNVMKHAQELVKKLRTLGKKIFFVTNNSTKTRDEFLVKFNKFGFEATVGEVISPSYLAALHLKENNFTKKAYVIGTTGITRELKAVGIESLPIGPDPISASEVSWLASEEINNLKLDPDVGAVIVGFDQFFCYKKMFKAASYLLNKETYFIATNPDEQFPAENNQLVVPGTGSIVIGVKTASAREPIVIGKPSKVMFDFIQRSYKVEPSRTLMIGDRGNTDILFGHNSNLWTLLVLTGVTSLTEAQTWHSKGSEEERKFVPHFYLNEVGDMYDLMTKNGL